MAAPRLVRVLPDVAAIRRQFDYLVPPVWFDDGRAELLAVGSMVRVELHGRRVGGWVTELDPRDPHDTDLLPLAKLSGAGPPAELIELAHWAARRWLGPPAAMLGTASPPKMVQRLPAPRPASPQAMPEVQLVREAFAGPRALVRLPPVGDRWPFVLGAVSQGNALVLVPSVAQAGILARRLSKRGVPTALYPHDWAQGAAGATVIGGRAAAFAPVADLTAVLVVDEHDEVYQEERSPTWHARDVVLERARRLGIPCVMTSPIPTVEAQEAAPLLSVSRREERDGWPLVEVVDPREDSAARGTLWTAPVVRMLRGEGRVACLLNRKGRSRLLVCSQCEALAVCEHCDGALRQDDGGELVCRQGHRRPVVCASCGATALKNLRIGVSRAREELEALLREPVVEVTAETTPAAVAEARVLVGTEALLHRVDGLTGVAFVDFDQELVAPRYRAAEEALALIVRAGRLVGGRGGDDGGRVLLQTRQPNHPVVRAAVTADVGSWSELEATRRQLLRYPPYAALAEISGVGAADYMERLGRPLGLEIRGPVEGRWLVRAEDHEALADALGPVERPKGRLRIAVDPLRLS